MDYSQRLAVVVNRKRQYSEFVTDIGGLHSVRAREIKYVPYGVRNTPSVFGGFRVSKVDIKSGADRSKALNLLFHFGKFPRQFVLLCNFGLKIAEDTLSKTFVICAHHIRSITCKKARAKKIVIYM